jgi:hypothetical protein
MFFSTSFRMGGHVTYVFDNMGPLLQIFLVIFIISFNIWKITINWFQVNTCKLKWYTTFQWNIYFSRFACTNYSMRQYFDENMRLHCAAKFCKHMGKYKSATSENIFHWNLEQGVCLLWSNRKNSKYHLSDPKWNR